MNVPALHEIVALTPSEFKIYENRLRRMARRQGLRLEKSRARDQRSYAYNTYQLTTGGYTIIERGCTALRTPGQVVYGDSNRGYGLSIEEIHYTLLGECTYAARRNDACTHRGNRAQDPYEYDVNNSPGVWIRACDSCLQDLKDSI